MSRPARLLVKLQTDTCKMDRHIGQQIHTYRILFYKLDVVMCVPRLHGMEKPLTCGGWHRSHQGCTWSSWWLANMCLQTTVDELKPANTLNESWTSHCSCAPSSGQHV